MAVDNTKKMASASARQQMTASGTGALITSIFMTPLDVVKVRLQAQQRLQLNRRCFLYCNGLMDHICSCQPSPAHNQRQWYSRAMPAPITGTLDGLMKIWRYEGISSLWSGLPPTLLVAVPNTIIYFTAYEQIRQLLQHYSNGSSKNTSQQSWWVPGVAGGVARVWSVTLCSPVELVRTKLQASRMMYKELLVQMGRELKHEGPRSLWRGWVPTVLRDVPFSVMYWVGYEHLKRLGGQTEHPSVPFTIMAGSLAGGLAATVTLPLDVVKTHKQIAIGNGSSSGGFSLADSSTLEHLRSIHRQQGVRGLFAGLGPRLVKVMPACAIMISSYEYVKRQLR
uniref:Solute carrier family 25 member 40-like isoform X2 n=1 Tax=Hirondellea gigas TaxID=1518452 RepID=A0A6A7FT82_9CRUS